MNAPIGDDSRPLYVFCHVPKCAGTTFAEHFHRHIPERILRPRRRRGFVTELGGGDMDVRQLPESLEGIDLLAGHSVSESVRRVVPGREVRPIIMLRDPVSLTISFYNYRNERAARQGLGPVPFDHFRRSLAKNTSSRFFLLRYLGIGYPKILALSSSRRLEIIEDALSRFWFVGSWRHVDMLLAELSRQFGIEPVAQRQNVSAGTSLRPSDLSEETREEIRADNALDQLLFDRWKDALWSGQPAEIDRLLPGSDQLSYIGNDAMRQVWKQVLVRAERRFGGFASVVRERA